jgi:hypothetical protein
MLLADIVTLLIPVWILLGLLALLGVFALLGRVRGGKYLRPIVGTIAKVPLFRRWLQKASNAALERSNPELASAMKKMQRSGAHCSRCRSSRVSAQRPRRRTGRCGAGSSARRRARAAAVSYAALR